MIFGIPIFGIVSRYRKLYTSNVVAKEKVCLENVCCENVVGKYVTIGEGCIIKGRVNIYRLTYAHIT